MTMASEALRELTEMIRELYAAQPIGSTDVATMRATFEAQQATQPLPADATRTALDLGGVPCCRITVPASRADHAVLYLHGGGYIIGSLDTHQECMARIAGSVRATVFGVDYRLAPEHPWPAAVEDATAAWNAMLASGIAPGRAIVAGDSAGGGLTLALLLTLRDAGGPIPAGAVTFSPWTDLTASGESLVTRAEADPMIRPEALTSTAAHYLGDHPPDLPTISPLHGDLQGLPPLLIQVGDAEVLLSDATRFHDRAIAAGVDSTLHVFDEAFHVFQMMSSLPEAAEALEEMAAFTDQVWS
jgi:acetyl esterase/lipase